MAIEHLSQNLFDNIKVNDLIKEIYNNRNDKNDQIAGIVDKLIPSINDQSAFILGPVVSNCINAAIKNDEQLIKLLSVVQKIIGSTEQVSQNVNSASTNEIQELIDNAVKSLEEYKNDNDINIDELQTESTNALLSIKRNEYIEHANDDDKITEFTTSN